MRGLPGLLLTQQQVYLLEDSQDDEHLVEEVNNEKYLGDIISKDGKHSKNINFHAFLSPPPPPPSVCINIKRWHFYLFQDPLRIWCKLAVQCTQLPEFTHFCIFDWILPYWSQMMKFCRIFAINFSKRKFGKKNETYKKVGFWMNGAEKKNLHQKYLKSFLSC